MSSAVCPECRTGKHPNCDGTAWDDDADSLTLCTCTGIDHPRQRLSCGCLLVVANRTLLEVCPDHQVPAGAVSIDESSP